MLESKILKNRLKELINKKQEDHSIRIFETENRFTLKKFELSLLDFFLRRFRGGFYWRFAYCLFRKLIYSWFSGTDSKKLLLVLLVGFVLTFFCFRRWSFTWTWPFSCSRTRLGSFRFFWSRTTFCLFLFILSFFFNLKSLQKRFKFSLLKSKY